MAAAAAAAAAEVQLPLKTAAAYPFAVLAVAKLRQCQISFRDDLDCAALGSEPNLSNQEILSTLLPSPSDPPSQHALFPLISSLQGSDFVSLCKVVDALDDVLAVQSFLQEQQQRPATGPVAGLLKKGQHPHLSRWYLFLETLPSTQQALQDLSHARSLHASSRTTGHSFDRPLQNAVQGAVVTRFPPEPSGYLHLGHIKAAMLNSYFAQIYEGRMILRFDDTNPLKEKEEFQDAIMEDLKLLGITADQTTFTSDWFDKIFELAVWMIGQGLAYADDTGVEQMREERGKGIASRHRDDSVEDNLKHFYMMRDSKVKLDWCLRAKISVDSPNKTMRDPVIYRSVVEPHHRTGNKWNIYPTYDLSCPVVDSLEGVTHTLRSDEYHDRNPQYYWFIDALNLRKPTIWDFGRMNFVYTLLSKRKLTKIVASGKVSGWDDPRFPTVRGIRRRGMTIEALKEYILLQGPSKQVVNLEWDKLWSANKRFIDPITPRYTAIGENQMVPVTVTNFTTTEVKALPRHKKNPELGTKDVVFSNQLILEQVDASILEQDEEFTLMDWGNAIVRKITRSTEGAITALEIELHLEGDFKKTKNKLTWLADKSERQKFCHVTMIDYDYLITKPKLEDEDVLEDFLTPQTEFKTEGVTSSIIAALKKGDMFQFERKGYFILDEVKDNGDIVALKIPDGRATSLASKVETVVKDVEKKVKKESAKLVAGVKNSVEAATSAISNLVLGEKASDVAASRSTMHYCEPLYNAATPKETSSRSTMHKAEPLY